MKKKAKTIWETDNYNDIEPHYLNRKIKSSHTKTLVEQIRYRDLGSSVPIILNENNMIIDGHHRFKAREQLGLNIFYVNHHGLVEEDIIMLNVNRSEWTTLEAGDCIRVLSRSGDYYIKQNGDKYHWTKAGKYRVKDITIDSSGNNTGIAVYGLTNRNSGYHWLYMGPEKQSEESPRQFNSPHKVVRIKAPRK